MNRNDKNKKFTPLNINNVFKGKSCENQNKTSFRVPGMQNIGKVSSNRRVPAPKWVPSIKAETGGSDSRQIINQPSSGWVNSSTQECTEQSIQHTQSSVGKDKNQWNSKITSNKPFFLMGQEFPTLATDVVYDPSIDNSRDVNKPKEVESVKSKLDELRNRDSRISESTLNRIDALSISRSSKGDIAATGWAAEDEEPNFDEKIIFSDEESLNDVQNWHAEAEVSISKPNDANDSQIERLHESSSVIVAAQPESQQTTAISIVDSWFEPSPVQHYSQNAQYQIQMNMSPNQFIASNAQFQQTIVNRPTIPHVGDDHMAMVAEQRNARNMEYFIAIERTRQKKMGTSRMYGASGEEMLHMDRSRHASLTSDTIESNHTPMEMGPPGGPPLMYSHLHRPHISPIIHPMMSPSQTQNINGPPLIQFTQSSQPFMVPIQTVSLEQMTDHKLMEKFFEFLKQQSPVAEAPGPVVVDTCNSRQVQLDRHLHEQPKNIINRPHESCNHKDESKQVLPRPQEIKTTTQDEGQVSRMSYNRAVDPRKTTGNACETRTAQSRQVEGNVVPIDPRNTFDDKSNSRQGQTRTVNSKKTTDNNLDTRIVNRTVLKTDNDATEESIVIRQPYDKAGDRRRTDDTRNNKALEVTKNMARQPYNRALEKKDIDNNSYETRIVHSKDNVGRTVLDDEGQVVKSCHNNKMLLDNDGSMNPRTVTHNDNVSLLSRSGYNHVVDRRRQEPQDDYNNSTAITSNFHSKHQRGGAFKKTVDCVSANEDLMAQTFNTKTDNWRSVQKKPINRNTTDNYQTSSDIISRQSFDETVSPLIDKKEGYETSKPSEEPEAIYKSKSNYITEDNGKSDGKRTVHHNQKYSNYKEYRSNKFSNYKGTEYNGNMDQEYDQKYHNQYRKIPCDDREMYNDYHGYQQHGYSSDYKNTYDYHKSHLYEQYYDEPYSADHSDYRSNSLKYKSTKPRDILKPSSSQTDCNQLDRSNTFTKKKSGSDIPAKSYPVKDAVDCTEWKVSNEASKYTKPSSNANKRYDNRPYKDRPTEYKQEYSMGFAVNPNDSRRNHYNNNYGRRVHNYDYSYTNYPSNSGSNNQYNENYYATDNKYYTENKYYPENHRYHSDNNTKYYQDNKYYAENNKYAGNKYASEKKPVERFSHQYDQEDAPSSSKNAVVKKSIKTEQWRNKDKSDIVETKVDNGQTKSGISRGNRKNDKRQPSKSKENLNENEPEEWETASEGVSDRRDTYKQYCRRHSDKQATNDDVNTVNKNSNNDNQATAENRYGLTNSCNGTWPTYPDEDESDGSSGPSGTARNANLVSNVTSQNMPAEAPQNQSYDNVDSSNCNKSSTGVSTSNNTVDNLFPTSRNCPYIDFIDIVNSSSVVNVDKLPEVTEDEELLYENVEQFQEVLSKATKKIRRLEEQRKLKEELEQKRLEELKNKNKNDNRITRKPVYLKQQSQQKTTKVNPSRKVEVKRSSDNFRDKDVLKISNNNNNISSKFENNKDSMLIGSWDNSLADDINSKAKLPPKPIGTPSSMSSWNVKLSPFSKSSSATTSNIIESQEMPDTVNINSKSHINVTTSQSPNNIYSSPFNSDTKYSSIFDRTDKNHKINEQLETQSVDISISDSITFDYNVNNNINCDNFEKDGLVSERVQQKNNQQLLNEKIHFVKTIWDNHPFATTSNHSDSNRTLVMSEPAVANVDIDSDDRKGNSGNLSRNIDTNLVTTTLSITNVCKVKPQLQNDFMKKEVQNSTTVPSIFTTSNSSATYLPQNQGNFIPYPHRIPSEYLQDHLQATDCLTSLLSANQPQVMHINYNLSNQHHLPAEHILSNKMNFISQQSFYPQAAVTPKLFSNAGPQLPLNMDMGSSHHGSLPLQQLLLTRQNSLTAMMQPNGMTLPFIQNGQQHAHNNALYPNNQILGPAAFSPQMHPFSPGNYSSGSFPSLHSNHQFQQNQMLINHHQQHQHQQQMIQNQLSHDRAINSGQSGIFNSIMGPSDISTNAGLPDFSGPSKHLTHNNIIHGMDGSAIMLPPNINYLMKQPNFVSNSQYNSFSVPIQSNQINVRNGYENYSNINLATEIEPYRSSKNPVIDRHAYCTDNMLGLSRQHDELYIDQNNYENCGINANNWTSNILPTNSTNFPQSFDFQSPRPIQFPFIDLSFPYNEPDFQTSISNGIDSHSSSSVNVNRNSQSIVPLQDRQLLRSVTKSGNATKQSCNNYNNVTCNELDYTSDKTTIKFNNQRVCDSTVVVDQNDGNYNEISFAKKSLKPRSSFSDNFETIDAHADNNCKEINLEMDLHIANKHYNSSSRQSLFNNQYGYNDTQLSSKTAESLGKLDSEHLKKMIMKLREGPVMTFADYELSSSDISSNIVKKSTMMSGLAMSGNNSTYTCHAADDNVAITADNDYFAAMRFYSRNGPLISPLIPKQSLSQARTSNNTNKSIAFSDNGSIIAIDDSIATNNSVNDTSLVDIDNTVR